MSDAERHSDASRHTERKKAPSRGSKPGERRGGGSRKGIPNKATANAKEAISAFVDAQSERLESLLTQIEEQQGPKAAWDCIMDLVEFAVPKLARTEVTGKDGGPQEVKTTLIVKGIVPDE